MATHILNGDSLKERFPQSIQGEVIIMRECLIDGPVSGQTVEELTRERSQFFASEYAMPANEYLSCTLPELEKISVLDDQEVYLWFEFDLFCQVNMWYVCHLLIQKNHVKKVKWVQPNLDNPYSFAHMTNTELELAFVRAIELIQDDLSMFSQLWQGYQQQNHEEMLTLNIPYAEKFPRLVDVIVADRDRELTTSKLGTPEKILIKAMQELKTHEFGPVFRRFSEQAAIYSFGDLQVKRLFDALNSTES